MKLSLQTECKKTGEHFKTASLIFSFYFISSTCMIKLVLRRLVPLKSTSSLKKKKIIYQHLHSWTWVMKLDCNNMHDKTREWIWNFLTNHTQPHSIGSCLKAEINHMTSYLKCTGRIRPWPTCFPNIHTNDLSNNTIKAVAILLPDNTIPASLHLLQIKTLYISYEWILLVHLR